MAKKKLGTLDGKDYYIIVEPLDKKETLGELFWRVPTIRESIVAEPGYVILSADFSQIEIKLMAFISQDPWLIEAINSGKDIHSFFATHIFGKELGFDYDLLNLARKNEDHPRFQELFLIRSGTKSTVFGIPIKLGLYKVTYRCKAGELRGNLEQTILSQA